MPNDDRDLIVTDKSIIASGAEAADPWKQLGSLLLDTSGDQSLEALQERLEETSSTRKNAPPGGAQVLPEGVRVLVDAAALAHSIDRFSRQLQQQVDTEREASRGLLAVLLDHLECVHTEAAEVAQIGQIRGHLEAPSRGSGAAAATSDRVSCLAAPGSPG